MPHGYGILPRLIPDPPRPAQPLRATPAWYSWPWTDQLIERDRTTLDALQADLDRIGTLSWGERRASYERLLDAYRKLSAHHRTIDDHIQYNRLWQAAIAKDRPGYDRQRTLYDAVVERKALLDALHTSDDAAFRAALHGITVDDPARPRDVLTTELRKREQVLAREIHAAIDPITPPSFVHVLHPAAHRWLVDVPVYTDIADPAFVRRFKEAIERLWNVHDGADQFRVHVSIIHMAASRVYRPEPPPPNATAIDVDAHCGRFPNDGAVLTTGANSTHVAIGRCIALGAQSASPHALAHEFDHVLGFRDVYFRGYRDLGMGGYQVMEVVADADDIMGAPGTGPVLRRHFEKLIRLCLKQ